MLKTESDQLCGILVAIDKLNIEQWQIHPAGVLGGAPLLPQRGTQGFVESTTEYGSDSRQKAGRCEYQAIQF